MKVKSKTIIAEPETFNGDDVKRHAARTDNETIRSVSSRGTVRTFSLQKMSGFKDDVPFDRPDASDDAAFSRVNIFDHIKIMRLLRLKTKFGNSV